MRDLPNYLSKNHYIGGTDGLVEVIVDDRETYLDSLGMKGVPYDPEVTKREDDMANITEPYWDLLHPRIVQVAKSRYKSGHLADSVEAALKEINSVVKKLVRQQTGQEFDGADLMNKALSLQNPIIKLDELSTETGKSIQKGYMQIFAGTMTGIRNPKAHDNVTIDEKRAIHLLFLASLLMYKIDEQK